ncbi:MAG: hypothetical protein LBC19_08735 [Tannerella sp.]|jgi:hypothetical protein|nr:hypothetical protein [Tannerella sp.]
MLYNTFCNMQDCRTPEGIVRNLRTKTSTTRRAVYELIGRLKEKYPSVGRYYNISYTVETETGKNRKTKASGRGR